jgi:hypothetical protein
VATVPVLKLPRRTRPPAWKVSRVWWPCGGGGDAMACGRCRRRRGRIPVRRRHRPGTERGPILGGGKPLVLEVRSPGDSWLKFDVVRCDARGGYHASYRFKFLGPADYQVRVLSQAEADYPFATGAAKVAGVRVLRSRIFSTIHDTSERIASCEVLEVRFIDILSGNGLECLPAERSVGVSPQIFVRARLS